LRQLKHEISDFQRQRSEEIEQFENYKKEEIKKLKYRFVCLYLLCFMVNSVEKKEKYLKHTKSNFYQNQTRKKGKKWKPSRMRYIHTHAHI